MKIPYQVLNDLIEKSQLKTNEIGGCFNFCKNGQYIGYTLMHGDNDFIEIPLDNCTISFHSHTPRTYYPGYHLDPPSPGDMTETIGKNRSYLLLSPEGVYEYGSISSNFRICDYISLYELIHKNESIEKEEQESILSCIEYHNGYNEVDNLLSRLSYLTGDYNDYIDFVDYLFRLMGSYLVFKPYPLTEDFHLLVSKEDSSAFFNTSDTD